VKLATFLPPEREEPVAGVLDGDRVAAFPGQLTVVEVLAFDELAIAGDFPADAESWPLSDVTLLAPVPEPPTVYAIGINWASHIKEMGDEPPEAPVVFVKVRGSVAPPSGPIAAPRSSAAWTTRASW
jgi:2-keto-4-pentenoate hydratase/2-oxohepta-3-ene-1,7-dioic acid hydratase in catechol pathway